MCTFTLEMAVEMNHERHEKHEKGAKRGLADAGSAAPANASA